MEAILKSPKYTDIKLAKGVFVDSTNYSDRTQTDVGISTKSFGRFWFHTPKGKAIFKTYDDYQSEIRDLRIVNELLCYELSKQMGIRCAEYELAHLADDVTGVVTYNVTKPSEQLINSVELYKRQYLSQRQDLVDYSKALAFYIKDGYDVDLDKAMKDLYKITLFDSLTMQSDRNSANIFFLIDEQNKTLKVAPLIDNEYAFNTQNFSKQLRENEDIKDSQFSERLDYIYKMITVDDEVRDDSTFKENVKQLVNIAYNDPECGKIFKNFMNGFDVKKAMEKLGKQGVEISPRYKEYLLMTEKVIKDLYRQELSSLKNNQNTNSSEDIYQ